MSIQAPEYESIFLKLATWQWDGEDIQDIMAISKIPLHELFPEKKYEWQKTIPENYRKNFSDYLGWHDSLNVKGFEILAIDKSGAALIQIRDDENKSILIDMDAMKASSIAEYCIARQNIESLQNTNQNLIHLKENSSQALSELGQSNIFTRWIKKLKYERADAALFDETAKVIQTEKARQVSCSESQPEFSRPKL